MTDIAMAFAAGCAAGAGSVLLAQFALIAWLFWCAPKVQRWLERQWRQAWGME